MKTLFEIDYWGCHYAVIEMDGRLFWCKVHKKEETGQLTDEYQMMVRLV